MRFEQKFKTLHVNNSQLKVILAKYFRKLTKIVIGRYVTNQEQHITNYRRQEKPMN